MVTPTAKRQAVAHACVVHGVSKRRACRILGVNRSSVRYRSRRASDDAARLRIRELAAQRRRFGYRRLHVLLGREGWRMNRKRFRRLYREEKLQVHRRSGRKRALAWVHRWRCPMHPTSVGRWNSHPTALQTGGGFAFWRSSTTSRV